MLRATRSAGAPDGTLQMGPKYAKTLLSALLHLAVGFRARLALGVVSLARRQCQNGMLSSLLTQRA